MKRNRSLPAALALLLVFGACSKKPQAAPAPAPQPSSTADDAARREAEERARREAEERARREAEARRRAELERARAVLTATVWFDYDSHEIRGDAKSALDAKVPLLRADPTLRLVIAGHADDRGSTEYNVALGQRRAQATRDYLAAFGIDASRLETVSYGEEQPLEPGEDEAAWSKNRRAEFRLGGGSMTSR